MFYRIMNDVHTVLRGTKYYIGLCGRQRLTKYSHN